ncbi:MAG: LytR C-terminal domain-containing protein [Calditrichia bacterium]|nr:LytR C-terminal domain-containing protein [Calditrichia bacterium]
MARRIRRDLSNRNIRKIIHKKQKESRKQAESQRKSHLGFFVIFKPILYIFVMICLVFIIYQVSTSLNFTEFFSKPDTITIGQQEGKPSANNKDEKKQQEKSKQRVVNPIEQKTQVEVLNGCGTSGIAKFVTDFLRKSEIDVVYLGNYKNFKVAKSQVIDRSGNPENARKVARILGISEKQVKSDIDKSKQLKASILLGKDYKTLTPFKKDQR